MGYSRSLVSKALTTARLSSSFPRRTFASASDHHGPVKVNCWSDPMSPSIWKEEHFVIVSLTGWGLLIFGGLKAFGGGKKDKDEKVAQAAQ